MRSLSFLIRAVDPPVQVPPDVLTIQITVAAELYYVAQVVEIGLVAEMEMQAFSNEWAYQLFSVRFRINAFKYVNLDDHDALLLHCS